MFGSGYENCPEFGVFPNSNIKIVEKDKIDIPKDFKI
jgi:hypothetical protein